MDYEKKYKDALGQAKSLYNSMFVNNDILEQIFPELKKSEDDTMIEIVKNIIAMTDKVSLDEISNIYGKSKDDIISWLEKQDKTDNNVDKIEPKFKVGDYIKHNLFCTFIAKVISVNGDCYELESIESHKRIKYSNAEQNFHLWTIRDAQDGDILSDNGKAFIFKGLDPHHLNSPVAYCGIDYDNCFIVGSGAKGGINWWCANKKVKPATKEQRDLLFTKMKEAGYEWIDYEKELVCAKN